MISHEISQVTKYGDCASVDPELFFPNNVHDSRKARAICLGCSVVDLCRDIAIPRADLLGIWGGMTEAQRQKARKEQKHEVQD